MPNGMEGWGALGQMLGGDVGTPGVYEDALSDAYNREYEMQRAREKRGQAIRSLVSADYFKQLPGMGGELGRSDAEMAVITAGGGNAQQLAGALGSFQEQGFRGGAVDAALGGNPDAANAYLAGVAGGPLQINDVTGGVATNPYQSDAPIRLTPLGETQVAENNASVASKMMRAGAAVEAAQALAEKRRRVDAPPTIDSAAATEGLPAAPESANIAHPQSSAERDALPVGTRYIAPDGTLWIKS